MKILVVCQYYRPEPFRIADICEGLSAMGHQVTVITGVPNYPEGEIYSGYEGSWGKETVENGVRVRRCYTVPRKTGAMYRILNYFSFPVSSCCCVSRLKEEYDVVLIHQLSPVMMAAAGLRYARKWKKKTVLYCLDLWPESLTAGGISRDSRIYRLFGKISRQIYRRVDKILVSSQGFAEYFRQELGIPGNYDHLPQYAEELFCDVPEKEPHGEPYQFVFAGNVGEAQSVDTIIGAAKLLAEDPRAVFHIVGDGSALAACKEQAAGLSNVIFHGRRDVQEMRGYYEMADAMLVTLKDNSGIAATLPGKVQSYMAAGKAILGAIGGETARVIRESGCGACSAPEDSEALAAQIRNLLDEPEAFGEYGRKARAYYHEHFRKETFLQRLEAVLRECSR